MPRQTEQSCRKRRRNVLTTTTTPAAGAPFLLPKDLHDEDSNESLCVPDITRLPLPSSFPVLSDTDDEADCFSDMHPFKGMRKEHETHITVQEEVKDSRIFPTAEELKHNLPGAAADEREAEDEKKLLVYVEHDASVVLRHPTPSFVVKPKTMNFPRYQFKRYLTTPLDVAPQSHIEGNGKQPTTTAAPPFIVIEAIDTQNSNREVVLKRANRAENHQNIEQDLQTLLRCKGHPNLVQLAEDHLVHFNGTPDELPDVDACKWLVVEALEPLRNQERLASVEVLHIAGATANALQFLHANGIAREVNPHHIFMEKKSGAKTVFKLNMIDVGSVEETMAAASQSYLAPEVFHGNVFPGSDLWGWACTVAHLATEIKPYRGENQSLPYTMTELQHQTFFSLEFQHFLLRCLEQDAWKRPCASEAIAACQTCLDAYRQPHQPSGARMTVVREPSSIGYVVATSQSHRQPSCTPLEQQHPPPPYMKQRTKSRKCKRAKSTSTSLCCSVASPTTATKSPSPTPCSTSSCLNCGSTNHMERDCPCPRVRRRQGR